MGFDLGYWKGYDPRTEEERSREIMALDQRLREERYARREAAAAAVTAFFADPRIADSTPIDLCLNALVLLGHRLDDVRSACLDLYYSRQGLAITARGTSLYESSRPKGAQRPLTAASLTAQPAASVQLTGCFVCAQPLANQFYVLSAPHPRCVLAACPTCFPTLDASFTIVGIFRAPEQEIPDAPDP